MPKRNWDQRIALQITSIALALMLGQPTLAQTNARQRLAPDAEIRQAFEPVIQDVRASVVELFIDGENRAMGTIIDREGHVLSKASELVDGEDWIALLIDGRRAEAELIGVDRHNDLAMLKIDAAGLEPVALVDDEPAMGRWVACVAQERSPRVVGIVSAQAREVKPPQLVLGVVLRPHPGGLRVEALSPGYGAERAGIARNDVITHVGDRKVIAVRQVVDRLQGQAVGDVVEVTVQRGDEALSLPIRLSELLPDPESRSERMNRMGGAVSDRRRGFERVLQHDAELRPEHCGGPLVNLKGEVVGINIARAGRIATYALPASLIQAKIEPLKNGELAPTKASAPQEPVAQPVDKGD